MALITNSRHRPRTRLAVLTGLAVAAAAVLPAVGASASTGTAKPKPKVKVQLHASGRYLALGDSVPFGYTPPQTTTLAQYANPVGFVNYPQYTASALGLKLTNAACPGETTTSYLAANTQSNGCENSFGSPVGYRTTFPLHQRYSGTQSAYAISYLKAHPDTSLVTLMIGANDAFLCQERTTDQCSAPSEFGPTFAAISANVGKILKQLRTTAKYTGEIALVTYYSTDYRDAFTSALIGALNGSITASAKTYKAVVVNGLAAMQSYAALSGGDTCGAGLLIKIPNVVPCNVHPTPYGHLVLAQALDAAVHTAVGKELAGRA